MRKLLLVGLLGCWSASPKPASPPAPAEPTAKASTGGDTYGGEEYAFASLTGTGDVDAAFGDPHGVQGSAGTRPTPPTVTIGDPSAQAGLDKAIIRRYIKRNQQKIQYCYEKELLANPSLGGRVDIRFTIGGNGTVVQATGTGMPHVDACVANVIAAIQFPAPQGGGVVAVSYPFIFQSASP
jgi:outer membrane biosynthesis protein TonB